MTVEQFVMAYGAEQDRLRAILPDGFRSLRPVLRINAEIRDGGSGYVEFNTAAEWEGKKGWVNIGFWENVPFEKKNGVTVFCTDFLRLEFSATGIAGGCPAEGDNVGCFFPGRGLRAPEPVGVPKEFCDCTFAWSFAQGGARGVSIGKTLPAIPTAPARTYPHADFTVENAAVIPCSAVLGAYCVRFDRTLPAVKM